MTTTVVSAWRAKGCLSASNPKGRGVLILASPTRYDLDHVRYISRFLKIRGKPKVTIY